MTTETKRRPADAADFAPAAVTVPTLYVARGRTVMRPSGRAGRAGSANEMVAHAPGTALEIEDPEERAHLIGTGFLVSEPPVLEAMTALESATQNPSNIGLQTQQVKFTGPVYTR